MQIRGITHITWMEQVMTENAAKPERQTEGASLYHISQDPSDDLIFLYRLVEVSVLCPSPGVTFKSSASVWMCLIKIYKQSHVQRYTGQVLAKSWISLRCESRFASWARTTSSAGPLSPHLRNNNRRRWYTWKVPMHICGISVHLNILCQLKVSLHLSNNVPIMRIECEKDVDFRRR